MPIVRRARAVSCTSSVVRARPAAEVDRHLGLRSAPPLAGTPRWSERTAWPPAQGDRPPTPNRRTCSEPSIQATRRRAATIEACATSDPCRRRSCTSTWRAACGSTPCGSSPPATVRRCPTAWARTAGRSRDRWTSSATTSSSVACSPRSKTSGGSPRSSAATSPRRVSATRKPSSAPGTMRGDWAAIGTVRSRRSWTGSRPASARTASRCGCAPTSCATPGWTTPTARWRSRFGMRAAAWSRWVAPAASAPASNRSHGISAPPRPPG